MDKRIILYGKDMNVRKVITMNRGVKYRIDGIFYESSMYIPEIVRDRVVDKYDLLDGVMIIKTKNKQNDDFKGGK